MDPIETAAPEIIDQAELHPATYVPVEVCGPVETRELPARISSFRGVPITAGTAVQVAGHDPRRKSLRVTAYDPSGSCTAVGLGNTKNEAEGAYAFLLPLTQTIAAGPARSDALIINSTNAVWAIPLVKSCTLSVISESWI